MKSHEEKILRSIRQHMPLACKCARLNVLISPGHTAGGLRWEPWLPWRSTEDDSRPDLFLDLMAMRDASEKHPRGAIWKLDWRVPRLGWATLKYWHEGDPLENLDEIRQPPEVPGLPPGLPMFPFRRGLPRHLLTQLTPGEAEQVIGTRGEFLDGHKQPMSAPLRELYAFSTFLGSVNNGGFDQWFGRRTTAHILGGGEAALLAARAGAARLGLDDCVAAFDRGLAIYASQQPYVAKVCSELGIAPAPPAAFQDDSQVNPLTRLVQNNSRAWDHAIGAYLLAHIDEFADPPADPRA